jgi:hypothetical protein
MAEAADGTIYVAGYTNGPLDGATAGTYDAFLRAVNPDGSVKWTRQLGSTGGDIGYSVAVAPNGNVYLVGEAGTVLPGSTQVGAFDAFIAAYSPAGSRLWVKQFGTAAGDVAQAVTVGPDSTAYVTGFVTGALTGTHAGLYDTFVRAYSSSGAVSWTTQFGSDKHDIPYGIARGADGTLYIGGSTEGSLPNGGRSNASGTDGYLVALSSSGSLSWTRQFGTASQDEVRDVTVSGSTVYVGGRTYGVLGSSSAGGQDGFLAGYSTSGDQLWLTQFGTPVSDSLSKIAAAPDGSLWVSGGTAGSLGGTSAGGNDGFLTRFSASGQMAGSSQYGTPSHDFATALTVTSSGVPYVALQTSGAVVGNSAGSIDVALLRLNAS